jgi:hypothetical protein
MFQRSRLRRLDQGPGVGENIGWRNRLGRRGHGGRRQGGGVRGQRVAAGGELEEIADV